MDGLAAEVCKLIKQYGASDVIMLVIASFVDGNVNNASIESKGDGVLTVKCGKTLVSLRQAKDATVDFAGMHLSPTEAGDVIRGLMVATCLAARERASEGP